MRSINAWSQGFSNLLVLVCKVGAYTVGQSNALDKVINQLIRTLKKAARMDVLNPSPVRLLPICSATGTRLWSSIGITLET